MELAIGSISYKSGYKHQLTNNVVFKTTVIGNSISIKYMKLTPDGTLILTLGYAWDGATGVKDSKTNLRASPGHDAFYQLIRQGHLSQEDRSRIDDWYVRECRKDGMWAFTAYFYNKTLKRLGGYFTSVGALKKITTLYLGGK